MATARQVLEAAQRISDDGGGYLGGQPSKVYISDVIADVPGLTKEDLIHMHQSGEIILSRLDLVAAAEQAGETTKLKKSTIRHYGAQYQLVNVPRPQYAANPGWTKVFG